MSVKLYPPGTRKGNTQWLAIIRVGGRPHERALGTASKREAQQVAALIEAQMVAEAAAGQQPKRGDVVTFAAAARLYAAYRGLDLDNPGVHRGPHRTEVKAINRLVERLGKQPVGEIGHPELVAAANALLPAAAPATRNRWVIKPGAAIVHYAAEQRFCGWERIKKFKEPRPKTRAVAFDAAAALVNAAPPGPRRLLLLWLFRHGTRITDTLQLRWGDNIDLERQRVTMWIGKPDKPSVKLLHPEIVEMLGAIPEGERTGPLFPWRTKSGVYRWLRPLAKRAGVKFTPHMGRHSVGTWLNEAGASLRTIMDALDHSDAASSIRYQAADIDVVAAVTARFARLTPPKAGNG
jgi:hypothetical protein